MKITMLGTGNALATKCYNTCFIIEDHSSLFMVDGGGGNTILRQIETAGYQCQNIHEIFVTHKHLDHLLGILWMIRVICQSMNHGDYVGEANIYAHDEVIKLLKELAGKLLKKKETHLIGDRLHLIEVHDGESRLINGRKITFFDIQSTKAKQFGFCMELDHKEKLTCCGDEPFSECERKYAEGSKWLLHEAFCLSSQADLFDPYEKHHSTVKDACQAAESLKVKNLLLYHTEDSNILIRKALYLEEGKKYFHGNLFVPDDLESIEI